MARESERVAYVVPSVPFQQKLPHHVSRRVGTQRVVDLRAQVIPRCLRLDRPRHSLNRFRQLEGHVLFPRNLVHHDALDVDRTQQEQRLFVLRLVDRVGVNLTVQNIQSKWKFKEIGITCGLYFISIKNIKDI